MQVLYNRFRGDSEAALVDGATVPYPSTDAEAVSALLSRCPAAMETPLVDSPDIAGQAGVGSVHVKDERGRMGLGSFKALGAAYVIACDAVATGKDDLAKALAGEIYITASAGNHGMSVAAGARVFGAKAAVVLSETVPESFADRLRAKGAEVLRAGAIYEDSMAFAAETAEKEGWHLLSDSSWAGYMDRPHRLMEGYLQMAAEAARQIPERPTHIFLQAGVGGLAGAVAAYARKVWGAYPRIVVVEPQAAPALTESIRAGRAVATTGPVSCMGRLDCKEPSLIALRGLARDADDFVTITEAEAKAALPALAAAGLETSASGGAGLAALLGASDSRDAIGLTATSRILTILSEEPAA
ncbi:pyridoxal-phosphate dependent enzyme [Rhodospirillaceae bacterium KN72]|uniref:Pyridoxal-phosphate dependent enzyme n=1 Tax=Pacificispira spongiicola TaxID=2729598 RepID=A0A7Y0HCQ4_9PROT|nr:pyridoxal-phosphate dependent enzyme [Pacificispira spongiicola]NMM42845.1 pyridoxal-phosphate dependent enzyme [Pacificispira spongiicola]